MNKIAILSDSSISIQKNDNLNNHVTLIPLTIIHNNTQYMDQVNLSSEQVNDFLRNKQLLQTSQPSIGSVINILEPMMEESYDHIYIVSLSSYLSGTFNSINQAINHLEMKNVTLIDTMSVAGPPHYIATSIMKMHQEGKTHEQIMEAVNSSLNDTTSFVYPETLEQLKRSGRISNGAATLASLLKIKPILYLENKGKTIEKFGTARTEAKVFETIIGAMKEHNVHPDTHVIYFLENLAIETVDRFKEAISKNLGSFETHVLTLPAVLATHVGIGAVALQWIKKI